MNVSKQVLGFSQSFIANIIRNRVFLDKFEPKGYYPVIEHYRNGKLFKTYRIDNGITNQGKNYLFDAGFHSGTQIATASWCISLIDSTGYTAVANADTMASKSWSEFTGYSQTTRVAWGQGAASGQTTTNGTPATFDISTAGTLKGIFVVSANDKAGTTGTLWSTGLFPGDVPVSVGDQFKITYAVAA